MADEQPQGIPASPPLKKPSDKFKSAGYEIPDDSEIETKGRKIDSPEMWGKYGHDYERRIHVMMETFFKLDTSSKREAYYERAKKNVRKWFKSARTNPTEKFQVIGGDWGETTLQLSRSHGKTFAVLNMANAYVAGGGYTEGMPAQEENMFRRTDCHFNVDEKEYDQQTDRYKPHITDLINGAEGEVYLDDINARVCIRGGEDSGKSDLGYKWLSDDEIFPFLELRSAAVDLRDRRVVFSKEECMKRICAQLDTLIKKGIRHAVLSAFGCGAFLNPPEIVAQCYCDALKAREKDFDCVAFAIFYPGYGNDNLSVFKRVFGKNAMECHMLAELPEGHCDAVGAVLQEGPGGALGAELPEGHCGALGAVLQEGHGGALVAIQVDGWDTVCLKSIPSSHGSILAHIPKGAQLTLLDEDYVKVSWNGIVGYVKKENVVRKHT